MGAESKNEFLWFLKKGNGFHLWFTTGRSQSKNSRYIHHDTQSLKKYFQGRVYLNSTATFKQYHQHKNSITNI